jgi:hypothetical protein
LTPVCHKLATYWIRFDAEIGRWFACSLAQFVVEFKIFHRHFF